MKLVLADAGLERGRGAGQGGRSLRGFVALDEQSRVLLGGCGQLPRPFDQLAAETLGLGLGGSKRLGIDLVLGQLSEPNLELRGARGGCSLSCLMPAQPPLEVDRAGRELVPARKRSLVAFGERACPRSRDGVIGGKALGASGGVVALSPSSASARVAAASRSARRASCRLVAASWSSSRSAIRAPASLRAVTSSSCLATSVA